MNEDMRVLADEIDRISSIVDELASRLSGFVQNELPLMGRTAVAASHVAVIIENTYTALETLFLRISQHFENSLDSARWHSDLLEKMTLHVTGIRERVIHDDTRRLLDELMRFRHFRRYYFELDFDWSKLDYLLGVYARMVPLVRRDLAQFKAFLEAMT